MGVALFYNLLVSMLYVFRQAVLLLFCLSDLTKKLDTMPDLHIRRLCIVLCVSAGAFSFCFKLLFP